MSLANKLSMKAKELQANPNAEPLQPEEAAAALEDHSTMITPQLKATEVPVGAYLAIRMNYLITADGAKVLPTNGFFVPKTREEAELLKYFADQNNGLVELVK